MNEGTRPNEWTDSWLRLNVRK